MNVILLGPPGSGKGTHGAMIARECSITHISSGDILRGEVKRGSALGKEARVYMDKGNLVPDALAVHIIERRVEQKDCKQGFLLDGFPRTVPQAETLDDILHLHGFEIDYVLHIVVPEGERMRRLLGRASKEGRSDDTEATIRNRFAIYEEKTKPLVDYYRKQNLLFDVENEDDIRALLASQA